VTGIVSVIVAIVLSIVLAWVTSRAWRLRNTPLRIVASIVSGLLTLVVAVVSLVGLAGIYRLYTPHGGPPAANHATPSRDLSLPAMLLIGAGLFPTAEQPHISAPQIAPPPNTPAYGEYLVDTTGCAACHGPDLRGRTPGGFGPPAGPNLHAIVPTW